jgi:hypothetical protein
MAGPGVDVDRKRQDGKARRCLGRVASTATVALASLALALGDPISAVATILVIGVWLWLAATVITGFVRIAIAGIAEVESQTRKNPCNLLLRVPRICAWTGVLLLATATAALFAAGQGGLATTIEVFLLWRLAIAMAGNRPCAPDRNAPAATVDYTPLTSGSGIFGICVTAGALWLALGTPPGWAESMILTYFWIVAIGAIVVGGGAAYGWIVGRTWMRKHHEETRQRSGARSEIPPPRLTPQTTPEPPRSLAQHFAMWLWRASWILVTWALWIAGQPLLAGLYLLASLFKLVIRVRARRERHGDTARIDVIGRMIYFIVWWPLVAVATSVVTAIVVPFIVFGAIWDRIFGIAPTTPKPQMDWEREARLERVPIRRAAASYRLREAFGKPGGFVYFLYSEPHQRRHFLEPGGLLADLGDRVVARDYRRHVLEARTTSNWKALQQSPEGALLRVNGISNMRRDLPFIAIVPPRGLLQVFRLSEPYRARQRDSGAALIKAEMDVRAAIAVTLGADIG